MRGAIQSLKGNAGFGLPVAYRAAYRIKTGCRQIDRLRVEDKLVEDKLIVKYSLTGKRYSLSVGKN